MLLWRNTTNTISGARDTSCGRRWDQQRADRDFYTHTIVARRQACAIEEDWPIPYWMHAADVAETSYTPFDSEPDAAPVRLTRTADPRHWYYRLSPLVPIGMTPELDRHAETETIRTHLPARQSPRDNVG